MTLGTIDIQYIDNKFAEKATKHNDSRELEFPPTIQLRENSTIEWLWRFRQGYSVFGFSDIFFTFSYKLL